MQTHAQNIKKTTKLQFQCQISIDIHSTIYLYFNKQLFVLFLRETDCEFENLKPLTSHL